MHFRISTIVAREAVNGWAVERPGGFSSAVSPPRQAGLLIVEDEALVALAMAEMLAAAGHEILDTAASGKAALEAAAKRVPDLVLMDITLRGAMDGIETAQALQAIAPMPILYVTAYSEGVIMERAQATRPAGYLRKPFYGQQLERAVEAALATVEASRLAV